MLNRLEKVDVWELQDRMARQLSRLANDHAFPYQTRKEIAEVNSSRKRQFEEIEELEGIRERLNKIFEDRGGLLAREQRSEIYSIVSSAYEFVAEFKRKRSLAGEQF